MVSVSCGVATLPSLSVSVMSTTALALSAPTAWLYALFCVNT